MYGGTGKLGRGAGGGKRNIHAPPINRSSAATSGGRLSATASASKSRDGGGEMACGPASSRQAEETFNLVTRHPLNFAMALRLVPDLVEEINRVEAMGGTARIKFDHNANNANGNVINVGGKNFNFTWSKEMGELCDIYEERKGGEDGNGLLIESGGAWRKLNVQRVLDESTTKHVKMRSEEAERKNKSRKSIVLDHQNSSMKNQMKALAAAESNSWRMPFKRKEPPFKKSKPEPYSGGPPKSVFKSGLSAQNPSKGRPSSGSSLTSHTEQHTAPSYPIGSSNPVKGHAVVSDAAPSQAPSKATNLDKETPGRIANNTVHNKSIQNQNVEATPFDLRSFMVSLLMEHQLEGMSLKALEKAVGAAMPNSVPKVQPILKQVATFQAPGRYFLKPGVDIGNFKKTSSGSGSSPEIVCNQSPAPDNFGRLADQDPSFSLRTSISELEEQAGLNSMSGYTSDVEEKINIQLNSPDHSNGKKVSDNSEGRDGSSSDGGSDSDSESNSSDSGSDSESRGREKRSPVGSRSGSSSDSESDVSSSSKQAPDEDVDIMTSDDGKEPKPESPSSKSPTQLRRLDDEPVDIGHYDKQDDWVSDVVEIENDNHDIGHETERGTRSYLFSEEGEDIKSSSSNHHKYYENQGYDSVAKDGLKNGDPDGCTRLPKGKSKRESNELHSDTPYSTKRMKGTNCSEPFSGTMTSLFGESPQNSSPHEPLKSPFEAPINQMVNRDGSNFDPNFQIGYNQVMQTGSMSESQVPGRRSSDASGRTEAHSNERRPGRKDSLGCGVESDRDLQPSGKQWMQNPVNMEAPNEDGDAGEKQLTLAESVSKRSKTMVKASDAGRHSKTQMEYSPRDSNTSTVDRYLGMNGRDNKLQRELSELELGEFREPLPDEMPGAKKGKYRKLENKSANSDSHRGKPSKKITPGSRRLSPQNSDTVVSGIPDGPSKREPQENYVNDPAKPQLRETRHMPKQQQSSAGLTEIVFNHNKIPETGKIRKAEAETQRTGSEANGCKKVPVNGTEQQHGLKGSGVSQSMNELKKQDANIIGSSSDIQKDAFIAASYNGIQKRRDSSPDEKSCSYIKYEKDEPELKCPIKDLSQYKEYVKEYQEKYESYCTLNNILESYRDEFSKLGSELETCRGRDNKRHQDILEKIRSSFQQCGEKHKRLKKIFTVLHEELRHLKQRIKDFAASYPRD